MSRARKRGRAPLICCAKLWPCSSVRGARPFSLKALNCNKMSKQNQTNAQPHAAAHNAGVLPKIRHCADQNHGRGGRVVTQLGDPLDSDVVERRGRDNGEADEEDVGHAVAELDVTNMQ